MSEEERIVRLDALAQSLTGKRKAVIDARAASGIEVVWLEDEDAFDGIDDLNRAMEGAQGTRHRYTKSKSSAGTYTANDTAVDPNRCILLPNITGPYVEAGAASIADMLLPLDDWPFAVGPTPIPELTALVEKMGDMPNEQAVIAPSMGISEPVAAGELRASSEREMAKGKACAEKAEKRIKDWLTECQWHGKSRRQIDDAARVGTGIVKGPIPQKKKQGVWHDDPTTGTKTLEIRDETKPVTDTVDFWNLYPDYPACGENIHNGSFIFERGEITRKTLQELRGQKGYLDSQIEECLREGPQKPQVEWRQHGQGDGPYEIWWFHGLLDRTDLEAAGCECPGEADKYIAIPAIITMVNDRPIRASLNHLDKGSFPYDILTWRRRPGMPWGQGIGRQIRPAQQAITACFRALMENAGLSAKPMLAVLRKYLTPTDKKWDLFGGKVFEVDEDADMNDVRASIMTITIDSRQGELLSIIQFNLKLAEDITGQPLLLQGQQGKAPDTVGGMTILQNNASVTKRRIARQFDDQVIEPGIGRYYDYLMQYGEHEEEKGLFVIDARASSVLVERDIQNKNMIQLLGASLNPAYGADPYKTFAEAARAMKIDPARIQHDEKKWKEIQDNAAKQPPDPRVQVAQMNVEAEAKLEAARQQFEAQQAEQERAHEAMMKSIDERLAMAEIGSEERQHLEKMKVALADTTLKLNTQRDLSLAGHKMALHTSAMKPPTEPAGRAEAGKAFQQ